MKRLQALKIFFIALVLSLGIFFIASQNFFQKWSWIVNDSFLYNAENKPSSEIVIVAIDDKSLADQALGRWQDWDRDLYANLIEILEVYQPAVIGLDITFSEHSQNIEADALLANVVQKYDNLVFAQDSGKNPILPEFKKDDTSVGIAEFPVDADQKVRRAKIVFEDTPYLHFSIAIIKKYFNLFDTKSYLDSKNQKYVISEAAVRRVGINSKIQSIPLDQDNQVYLNFFGPPNSFNFLSLIDVLQGKIQPTDLKGKIVLIGEDASSLYDEKVVPISGGKPMPGVELHANFIQTILDGKFLIPQNHWQEFLSIFISILISSYLFGFLTPLYVTLSFFLLTFCIVLIWAQLAPQLGQIVNIFYLILGVVLSYIVIFVYRYIGVEKARKKIERAFSMYVSKDIVAEIKSHPEKLHLGGEKREMTAFFSDIAGFTSLSETMPPEQLVSFLNEYFAAMTKILFRYRGTLDKYEGDAIMAFWNAPVLQKNHAVLACQAALKMQMHLVTLGLKWKKEGKPQIQVRMGINTGEMIVGNVGSEERFNYTIMGDAVNLSSRLEGANKFYNTFILISESTFLIVKDFFETRELDLLKVKGKNQAVKVYELISSKGQLPEEKKRFLPHYRAGLEAYYQRKFDFALTHFEKAEGILPQDQATQIYLERCRYFKDNPPAKDWDGSFQMQTK